MHERIPSSETKQYFEKVFVPLFMLEISRLMEIIDYLHSFKTFFRKTILFMGTVQHFGTQKQGFFTRKTDHLLLGETWEVSRKKSFDRILRV